MEIVKIAYFALLCREHTAWFSKLSDCGSSHTTQLSEVLFSCCWEHTTQIIVDKGSDITQLFKNKTRQQLSLVYKLIYTNEVMKGEKIKIERLDFSLVKNCSPQACNTSCVYDDFQWKRRKKKRKKRLPREAMLADVLLQVNDFSPWNFLCPVSCLLLGCR